MPDVTLNSGQSSSITRTVRMSCFQGDNRQCGTEEGEPIVFVFWFTCCKIVYWLLMLSSVIVSGRYIAWYDPCSGHRSHNHFSNKNWTFIAVTSDLQCVWIFQMSETTLHNSYFYLWVLTLFAELPRVEQNGSGTSPSSNVLPLGQLLCLPGMHCLRRSINCSPKRRKKKNGSSVHTQVDPTRHDGEFMHHLVLNIRGFSIPWHTSTPPSKSLDKFRCVFICFFGRCAAESDRQTWISLAERPRPC